MPGIKYRISLEGGEQVQKELLTVEQSVKRLQNAAKSGAGADTFASTTTAISTLGKTADEALSAAAAAAKKFGASSSDLARVEGVIKALAARSRDSSIAFATLAQNYDKARASISGSGEAAAAAGAGLGRTAVAAGEAALAAKGLNTALGLTRTQIGAVAQVAAAAGAGPLGRLASALGGATVSLGGLAAAAAGVAVAGGTLFTFAQAAAESAKALQTLSQVSGQSFDSLSALQSAFGELGISAETFQQTFTNLFQQLSAQAPQLAAAFAGATDKSASSLNALKSAQLDLAKIDVGEKLRKGMMSASEAARQLLQIEVDRRDLAKQNAEIAVRGADRSAQIEQANNLQKVVELMKQLGQGSKDVKFDFLTTVDTKAQALSARLLQVQQAGGSVVGELSNILQAMKAVDAFNVGAKLGIPPEVIASILRYKGSIEGLAEILQKTGRVPLSEADIAPLLRLSEGIKKVGADWEIFKQRLGIAVAPIFNDLLEQVLNFGIGTLQTFQTIEQAWGLLKSAFTEPLLPPSVLEGMSKITTPLREGLESLKKDIDNNLRGLNQAATEGPKVGAGVTQGATVAESATDKLIKKLEELRNSLAKTKKEGADLGKTIPPPGGRDITPVGRPVTGRDITPVGRDVTPFGTRYAPGAGPPPVQPGQISTAPLQQFEAAAAAMVQRIRELFSGLGDSITINVDFSSITNAAQTAATELQQLFSTALQNIAATGAGAIDFSGITNAAQTAATGVGSAFSNIDIAGPLSGQIDALIQKFSQLAQAAAAAAKAAAAAASGGGGGTAPAPFARGGLFGGRGTGTSDSNLAWVSRGEHIMPARAVRQPGVLAFLEALRRSGGDLSRILDGMGRFALGGMVPMRAIPAFANGGPVGSMSNVTIQFPGVPPISGLRASSEVVDQLHKAAALAQVRSGGRKPSRYS